MPKTVLMITQAFHPSNASSVHRPVGFAKYLPQHGWTPIVLCKAFDEKADRSTYDHGLAQIPDSCEVIHVDHAQTRTRARAERLAWKMFRVGKDEYRHPYGLYRRMRQKAEAVVRSRHIDVIWSTYPPGPDHAVAAYISNKYGIAWVADFRDLPDQTYDTPNTRYAVRQERRFCDSASMIVAVTDELAAKLRQRHQVPVHTIFNGFDPDDYDTPQAQTDLDKKFTINHFGRLYPYRDPAVLFEALDGLIGSRVVRADDIRIGFYGASGRAVRRFARGYRCAAQVQTLARLPYRQMIARQKTSQLLLLLTSPGQGGAIPGKLYGYLASRRPIVSVPGDRMGADRIVAATRTGIAADDPAQLAHWLEAAYRAWQETGRVPYQGQTDEIARYSHQAQTPALAAVLDTVCGLAVPMTTVLCA
jgi:glycosyltransferase involved in cell wall biosynthesis